MKNVIAAAAMVLFIATPALAQSTTAVPVRVDEFDNPLDDVAPNTHRSEPRADTTHTIKFGAIADGDGSAKVASPQPKSHDQRGDQAKSDRPD